MKRMGKVIVGSGLALLSFAGLLHARGAGSEGAAFLKIPVSARVIATGETASLATGVDAIHHNPAGLSLAQGWELASHNLVSPGFLQMNNLSAARALGNGGIGVSFTAFTQPALDGYDNQGNALGNFKASDSQATVAFGRNAGRLQIGLAGKFLFSEIGNARSRSWAVDAGARLPLSRGISLGAALLNLGPAVGFDREKSPLPLQAKAGAAWQIQALSFSGEVTQSIHAGQTRFALGVEYRLPLSSLSTLSLRGGYSPLSGSKESSFFLNGLRSGLGLSIGSMSVDYAAAPADLNVSHRLSFGLKFGARPHRVK